MCFFSFEIGHTESEKQQPNKIRILKKPQLLEFINNQQWACQRNLRGLHKSEELIYGRVEPRSGACLNSASESFIIILPGFSITQAGETNTSRSSLH